MLRKNADARRCSYFELGLPVLSHVHASVNSSCAASPGLASPQTSFGLVCHAFRNECVTNEPGGYPRANPRALAFIIPRMANSQGWRLLSCQIPRGEDEKRGQMPLPPSTLQHFSLIAQSNSAFLSILMCDFLFQVTSSFVIALGF